MAAEHTPSLCLSPETLGSSCTAPPLHHQVALLLLLCIPTSVQLALITRKASNHKATQLAGEQPAGPPQVPAMVHTALCRNR